MSAARQNIFNETHLVQKVVYMYSKSNNALPHQPVTMQGLVLKFETFVAIRIDFIKDFTYLLHFCFSEKANVMRTVWRKK